MAQALTRHFNPSIFALTNKYIRLKMHYIVYDEKQFELWS